MNFRIIIRVFVKPIICALKAPKIEKKIVCYSLCINIQNNLYEVILFCLEKCVFLLIFDFITKWFLTGRTTNVKTSKVIPMDSQYCVKLCKFFKSSRESKTIEIFKFQEIVFE